MSGNKKIITGLALLCILAGSPGFAGDDSLLSISGNRILLIVPARQRIVQLGFDMLALRPRLLLMTYQGTAEDNDAGMQVWNGERWLRLSEADYGAGRFLRPGAVVHQVFLTGTEQDVPWVLQYRPAWAEDMQWIQSLQTTDLVNVLGSRFRFTREEWAWISGLHDLRLFESTIRRRHVQRQETWPDISPAEARMPVLERVRSGFPTPGQTQAEPVRVERQPWVEIPVRGGQPILPMQSSPIDSVPVADPPEKATPPAMPPSAVEPVTEPPAIPEPQTETPDVIVPEPEILEKGARPVVPADAVPPGVDAKPMEADPATESTVLTPEELRFFELIRQEFPDLDDLPGLR